MLFPTLFLCLSWVCRGTGEAPRRRPPAKPTALRRPFRSSLELLEDRALPSSYTTATASDLIADINAANKAGGTSTITLTAPTTSPYVLSGLVIAKNDTLTILGNGDTIDASHAGRLFDVAKGGSLTLESLTLQNGLAFGSGAAAEGGAIYNQGTLVLSGVTVQGNVAQGSDGTYYVDGKNARATPGNPAAGGGIWSDGSLTLENGTLIENNEAIGGNGIGGPASNPIGSDAGDAFGGGLCISGGQANLTGVTVSNNSASGGPIGASEGNAYGGGLEVAGGTAKLSGDTLEGNISGLVPYSYQGAHGSGGGMYLAGGTVTLCNDTIENNHSLGGYGAGIAITPKAKVYIDSFTVANTINNTDYYYGTDNIGGSYTLRNC
jgi:hypothetical protein